MSARFDYDPVIAKAWASRRFKARLLAEPRAAMATLGIVPPPGVTIKVIADTPETCTLVLPSPPAPGVSLAEQLLTVAGGVPRAARLLSNFDRIVTSAWAAPGHKARLLGEPRAAFAALGVTPPEGISFTVVEDSDSLRHLVLPPPPPREVEFSEEAGGMVNHLARWLALISAPFAS